MIDERFLLASVNIRRRYLGLANNLDSYRKKAELTLKDLEKAKDDLKKIEQGNYDKENLSGLQQIVNIITYLEESQASLERFLEPINKNIEKLLIEERDLYNKICEKHSNYTEQQIVQIVTERLEKENLL
jgi:hypothetical protein